MSEHEMLSDASIGKWLAARRKLIVGLLAIGSIITSAQLDASLVIQALFGFLGVYGIHEVANDA